MMQQFIENTHLQFGGSVGWDQTKGFYPSF